MSILLLYFALAYIIGVIVQALKDTARQCQRARAAPLPSVRKSSLQYRQPSAPKPIDHAKLAAQIARAQAQYQRKAEQERKAEERAKKEQDKRERTTAEAQSVIDHYTPVLRDIYADKQAAEALYRSRLAQGCTPEEADKLKRKVYALNERAFTIERKLEKAYFTVGI